MQSQQENKSPDQYTWPTNHHQDQHMEVETEFPEQDIVDLYTQMDNDFVLTTYEEAQLLRLQAQLQALIETRFWWSLDTDRTVWEQLDGQILVAPEMEQRSKEEKVSDTEITWFNV